ncbi:MAG TPA: hypothetical protein VGL56_17580 [Fimbriimonadaceae bacterium]|jgi:hypothetical protein
MGVKLIKVSRLQGLLILLILAVSAPFSYAGTDFSFSESKVDISPPEPLPLGGYTARHGKVMDEGGQPLYARCVLFQYGGLEIALVSAEMLTIPDSLAEEVSKHIPPNVMLFLCATHTHSAPDSQLLNDHMTFSIPGIASFKHRWLDWYSKQIALAVNTAVTAPRQKIDKLQVVQFKEELNRGRRFKAKPDQLVTVLEAILAPANRSIQNLFLEYAAHAVFYGADNNKTNGDWPGEVSSRVEADRIGSAFPVLEGAIGDVSPHAQGATPQDQINNFASTMLEGLVKAQSRGETIWQAKDKGNMIRYVREPIQIDPPTPSKAFMKDYHLPKELAEIMVKQFAPTSANITALRFGSLAVIGVPGEPTSALGHEIKLAGALIGFRSVLVVSHVNGWIGYELDPKDYTRGGYEASLSFNGPKEGVHIVAAAVKALKALSKKNGKSEGGKQ